MNVYSSSIQKSPKVETTEMFINGWMDKENVEAYNGTLLSNKEERSTDICYSMDEPWKQYAKWKKTDTLSDSIYMKCPDWQIHGDRK